MPIYEYRCQQCGKQFEEFVRSMAKLGKVVCPQCGGTQTERSLSVFSTSGASSSRSTTSTPAPTGSTCLPSG